MKKYIQIMRLQHWIKNLLVAVPIFFAGKLFDVMIVWRLLLGFFAFSFVASAVYIFNDVKDIEKDQKHATKKNRPIAAGIISEKAAYTQGFILVVLAGIIVTVLLKYNWKQAGVLLLVYLFVNLGYSLGLKNKPIIDVMILASGFVLRILYGGIITGCPISNWLCLTIMMFSLYMGLGKRRNELQKAEKNETRKVLAYYSESFLSRSMLFCMTLGMAFYAYWSAIVVNQRRYMIWTIPLVIAILMKYELDLENDNFGEPVDMLLEDKVLIVLTLVYGIVVLFLLYGSI